MYVNPFWFGVSSTIGVGAILLIVAAVWVAFKKRK